MVNPGAFQGARRAFLLTQKSEYATAVVMNMHASCIADIQRRFFKRFPLGMDEADEPSEDFLAAVDDDVADPEPPAPDEDILLAEEYAEAVREFETRSELLIFRRKVSGPSFATNNVKLTHRAANQTLDQVPARQGPWVLQGRLSW